MEAFFYRPRIEFPSFYFPFWKSWFVTLDVRQKQQNSDKRPFLGKEKEQNGWLGFRQTHPFSRIKTPAPPPPGCPQPESFVHLPFRRKENKKCATGHRSVAVDKLPRNTSLIFLCQTGLTQFYNHNFVNDRLCHFRARTTNPLQNCSDTLTSKPWAVGRAVASNTRDLRFKSRHQQNFIYQLYNRKDENQEKKAENGPSLKKPSKPCCSRT